MSEKKEKFIIIDGNALLHRAWHALPPLKTKEGELVNAVYGFTSILIKVLKEIQPEYAAVTFDRREPTFRHEEYEEYKATRQKQPDELYDQIPRIKEVVEAFGMPIYEKVGFEADDLIGTICTLKSVDRRDMDSVVVTGDLDTLQLVDDNTKVYTTRKGITDTVLYDEAAVFERYGFGPERLIDYKALRGDASDNIPGVPGIGEKTAVELIKEFGSLENIYKNLDNKKIKDRVRKLLKENKEKAEMSKKLATIVTDVKINFNLKDAKLEELDTEKIVSLFQELGFKSLVNKLPGEEAASADSAKKKLKTAHNYNYLIIDSKKSFDEFLRELKKQKVFCLDTETTSLNALEAKLLGISFSWKKYEAYYVVIRNQKKFVGRDFLKKLKPTLENADIKKFGHHIKYDLEVLHGEGIDMCGIDFDTMLASYLLNPGSRGHNLDQVVFGELGHRMISFDDLVGSGRDKKEINEVMLDDLAHYSCEDADFTWQLRAGFEKEIKKENLNSILCKIEVPLIKVLAEMEEAGVKIDVKLLSKMSREAEKRINILSKKIYKICGTEFNINSPAQLKEVLFEKMGISSKGLKKTKTGISTAASELEKLRGRHQIIDFIFEHRELAKLKSTYLDALPKLVNKKTGRVHTSFNQTITATGRLSSSNPNLQNIPIRTELGRKIRQAFVADRGYKILAVDYSQIELRLLAHLSDDPKMIKAFKRGADIHTSTAAEIWNVKPKEVSKEMRRAAKAINFGISYGMGQRALAQSAGVSTEEAKDFIDRYFSLYVNIKEYMEYNKQYARDKGYVQTLFGRKRYLPDINSGLPQLRAAAERMAINMPVQGTAADIIKLAMIELYRALPEFNSKIKMVLQVHDELVFEVPEKDLKKASEFITGKMENIFKLKVPLIADAGSGDNWGELKDL